MSSRLKYKYKYKYKRCNYKYQYQYMKYKYEYRKSKYTRLPVQVQSTMAQNFIILNISQKSLVSLKCTE